MDRGILAAYRRARPSLLHALIVRIVKSAAWALRGQVGRIAARLNRAAIIESSGSEPCHVEPFPAFFGVPEVILNLLVEPAFRSGAKGDG
jgi:hypothetical protein